MDSAAGHEVTAWLRAWSQGDSAALDRLIPVVDRELRVIASRSLDGWRHDPILDTTALIHEAYLRLIGARQPDWRDRVHFYAVCAKIMRRILVDYVRACRAAKRGGGALSLPLDDAAAAPEPISDVVAIDQALEALGKLDERKGRVVELRFFGGLNVEETAEVLKISPETVRRDWRMAKAWLLRELSREQAL